MRRSNEQSLGEVIRQLIKVYRFEDKITEVRIQSAWEKVMGRQIHTLTEKIVFKDHSLTIYLRSAPLREELSMARTRIMELINKEVGSQAVREIILR